MGCLRLKELLLKGLIRDEIRLNVSLKECSREFFENDDVQITVGTVQMLNEIVRRSRSRTASSTSVIFLIC